MGQTQHKMIGINTPLSVHARIKRLYKSMPEDQRPKRMSVFCVSLLRLGLDVLEGRTSFNEKPKRKYRMNAHRLQTFSEPKGF